MVFSYHKFFLINKEMSRFLLELTKFLKVSKMRINSQLKLNSACTNSQKSIHQLILKRN